MKFKFISTVALSLVVSLGGVVSTANAGLITKSFVHNNWDNAEIDDNAPAKLEDLSIGNIFAPYELGVLVGDVTFTWQMKGNFGVSSPWNTQEGLDKNAEVFFGDTSLGIWLNGVNDQQFLSFGNGFRVDAVDGSMTHNSQASFTLSEADARAIFSGNSEVRFEFSDTVYNLRNKGRAAENVKFTVNYTIPEPSTLAILGLGLMGLSLRRLKKAA